MIKCQKCGVEGEVTDKFPVFWVDANLCESCNELYLEARKSKDYKIGDFLR